MLFAADLIRETEEKQATGGRPSKLLRVNEGFALVIAVDIGESLTRVALTEGSLVVNSSQGGGVKDTWVLAE